MTNKITHASVFSGIGGPEVAASMLGWENLFHCEINPFGRAVLDYWYPNAKSYDDITTTDFTEWNGRVNVLTGGFPCQPFSYAGQRRGATDDRYLWPYMFRCIDQIRPDWVVAENVTGILTMVEQGEVSEVASTTDLFGQVDAVRGYRLRETFTLQRICDDLESHGYSVQPILIPACAVGAPHRRDRVFIIGNRNDIADTTLWRVSGCRNNGEQCEERNNGQYQQSSEQSGVRHKQGRNCDGSRKSSTENVVADTNGDKLDGLRGTAREERTLREVEVGKDVSCTGYGMDIYSDPCWTGEHRDAAYTDGNRGSQVDEHMESELTDGAESFGNGWKWNAADTESGRAGRLREQGEAQGSRMRDVVSGDSSRLCGDSESAGLGRWDSFPTVSPVHRGNDGIPFSLGDLTISPAKWRTESLKAYGNAIVPQVMYEIFRAIEITYKQ